MQTAVLIWAKSPTKKIRNAEIFFLWPPNISISDIKGLSDKDVNDTSLVIKIKYGRTSFLITGDISSNIENLLIHSGKDLKSDVLFVPHHGSVHSSSTGFIRKVACRYAIISAGKDNPFHRPHLLILERYKTAQAQILRTDLDGAITMTTDSAKLFIETFVKHR